MSSTDQSLQSRSVDPACARAEWLDPRFQRLIAVQMAFGYTFSALLVAPKFLTVALHASPLELGELSAISAVSGIATAPVCGRWLDRGGARAAILVGCAVLALSVGSFGLFTSVTPALFALRAVQGVGNTLVIGGSAALVTSFVAPAHHARAFGLAGAAALAMNAVGSSGTEQLAQAFGWDVAYAVAGCSVLFALAMTATIASESRSQELAPAATAPAVTRAAAPIAWGALAAGAGFATLATYTQPFALTLGAEQVSTLFVGYTVTALLVRLTLSGAADRLGRRRTATGALAIYVVTLLAASGLQPSWLFFLGLGFGAAHGLVWPSLNALAVARAAPGRTGSALARLHALFGVGSITGVWGSGYLIDTLGYPSSFLIAAGFVAAGALSLGYPRRLASSE